VPKNVVLPFQGAECFITPSIDDADIKVESDIVFATDVNPWTRKNETLKMDLYYGANDQRKARPVLVHAHGGAYLYGSKTDKPEQLRAMASRGYVVASINYRLVPLLAFGALSTRQPPKVGGEDFRAAVRFLRKHASEWNLDENRIALTGNSAGALSALYVAYAKKEQSEGNGGNLEYSSAINAVVSFSGGLRDRALCQSADNVTFEPHKCTIDGEDDTDEMSTGDVPAVYVHGTADVTVPYANGLEAALRANATSVTNQLLSIPGAAHVPSDDFLSPDEPYLEQWTTFLAAALNTAEAECPTKSTMEV